MNQPTLEKICGELAAALIGQKFGKIFPLSRLQTAFDFRLPDSTYLFVSVEPHAPRIYLIRRRLRDLEKNSGTPSTFVNFLRKRLAHSLLTSIEKLDGERVLRFSLAAETEIGAPVNYDLIVQLTGRSANLFLLDEAGFILDSLRETRGDGQETATRYAPPARDAAPVRRDAETAFPQNGAETLSEALDIFYLADAAEKQFQAKARHAAGKLKNEIKKREKLLVKLNQDLQNHGDALRWKHFGDLILANLADAVRIGDKVLVVDYFDENVPTLEIEVDENDSLTAAAEKFFRRYTKARNAGAEIAKRLDVTRAELERLSTDKARLDEAVEQKNEDLTAEFFDEVPEKSVLKNRDKPAESFTGARSFISSDGFEILVGKASKDNDFLTFRVAKSLDLWLHAADYPGSHVIIRNPNRREIPPSTLLEAAQVTAFYSQARAQPKVAVHYAQKKFVNKPKGAAAGLVSLSSFKTILVEPQITVEQK